MPGLDDVDKLLAKWELPFNPAPLQKSDALEMVEAGKFGLFYEVGVGKTLVSTIAAVLSDKPYKIVIGPPILSEQWKAWLESIGEKDVMIYEGAKRTSDMLDHEWVIMSHNIFRDSNKIIMDKYLQRGLVLIVDEAQALKNPGSKLYRYVKAVSESDAFLFLLTATPTTKPQDTFTYMKLKTPKVYRNIGQWESIHVAARDIFKQITEYRHLDMLADNFAIQTATRSKKEVYGITLDPIYQPIQYRLSKPHQRLYEQLAEEQMLVFDNGGMIDGTSAQKLRHMLQQIIVNYGAFSGDPADKSAAFDLLDQVIGEVDPFKPGNSKLVIWTYYQSTSKLVTEYLVAKYGTDAVTAAYGGVDSKKAVKRIMEEEATRLMVAQALSVGAGLNLQAVCWEAFFLEYSTVPMHVKQAMGRIDRAGQKNRPTMRFAQALRTVQPRLFESLLKNDELVVQIERTPASLRREIYGE